MRIGLIGGPGSKKSDLAKHIRSKYDQLKIIDNYVKKLSKRVDVEFGPFASHLGNVQIAIERLNCELQVDGDDFITCGTVIETMAYDAAYASQINSNHIERARITTVMDFYGMMMNDTFLYDRLFFLPSEDETLDFQIKYAIRLFNLRPLEITDNFDEAIANIEEWKRIVDEFRSAEIDE